MTIVTEISEAIGKKKFTDCKIFILNAQADKDLALELIAMFRDKGMLCWDTNCILPGQDHNVEQEKAVCDADFVIAIFSKGSLKEAGRYAKLLRVAYEAQLETPEGGIKLIAVLVEACEMPYEYNKYQPLDLTVLNSATRLVQSFEKEFARRKRLNIKPAKPQAFWK